MIMVTPLDTGLLQKFETLFPFLLVFVIVYAILTRTAAFKDKEFIAAVIAFVLAITTLFSRIAVKSILLMAPWFVLFFIIIVFGVVVYQAFGIEEKTIIETITGKEYGKTFGNFMLALILIIGLGSISYVYSQEQGFLRLSGGANVSVVPQDGEVGGFWGVLTNAKVLGMILLFLVGLFTVRFLSETPS